MGYVKQHIGACKSLTFRVNVSISQASLLLFKPTQCIINRKYSP